jgi:hypothetical protein
LPFTLVSSNGTEVARGFANGRFGIGTGANDSGALLQVGANLATGYATAGMSFGGDTFLYRSAAGCVTVDQSAAFSKLRLAESGVLKLQIESANGDCFISTETAGKSITLRTGVEVTALTLDSSQNANVAGHVFASAASSVGINGRAVMRSSADGVMRLTNFGDTDFTRLQFGGTTNAFPALKRSGAGLLAVLADDSAYANLYALNHMSTGAAASVGAGIIAYGGTTATTVGAAGGASALPATPTGYIIVNVAGTQMKVPYYAN